MIAWCVLCKQRLASNRNSLCPACLAAISSMLFVSFQWSYCDRCLAPLLHEHAVCACEGSSSVVQSSALGPSKGALKILIDQYRIHNDKRLAITIAMLVAKHIERMSGHDMETVIIPMYKKVRRLQNRTSMISGLKTIATMATSLRKYNKNRYNIEIVNIHGMDTTRISPDIHDVKTFARHQVIVIDWDYSNKAMFHSCIDVLKKKGALTIWFLCLEART
ncbi:MAG: hypothetical protein WDA14_07070 [Sphaerochaetaceae bacterium]|nr:hypothetical protein [Spirochaetales bacterium]